MFGEPNDKMYIVLDGQVDFIIDMEKSALSNVEVDLLGKDVGFNEIGK